MWEEENIYESFSEVGTATRQMYVKLAENMRTDILVTET
jgi:hypothetical protein